MNITIRWNSEGASAGVADFIDRLNTSLRADFNELKLDICRAITGGIDSINQNDLAAF